MPESFRWLFTKGRYDDAEAVIDKVARINGNKKPNITKIINQAKLEEKEEKQYYSALDLLKTKESVIKTLALLFIWYVSLFVICICFSLWTLLLQWTLATTTPFVPKDVAIKMNLLL